MYYTIRYLILFYNGIKDLTTLHGCLKLMSIPWWKEFYLRTTRLSAFQRRNVFECFWTWLTHSTLAKVNLYADGWNSWMSYHISHELWQIYYITFGWSFGKGEGLGRYGNSKHAEEWVCMFETQELASLADFKVVISTMVNESVGICLCVWVF